MITTRVPVVKKLTWQLFRHNEQKRKLNYVCLVILMYLLLLPVTPKYIYQVALALLQSYVVDLQNSCVYICVFHLIARVI